MTVFEGAPPRRAQMFADGVALEVDPDGGLLVHVVNQGSEGTVTGSTSGPANYVAGGFVVDLSASLSSVDFFMLAVTAVGPNLPPCHYEYALNVPANGKITVKVMRHRYDKLTAIGNVSGAPSGVTVANASGQTTSANQSSPLTPTTGVEGSAADDATHTHTMDTLYQHQHGNTQAQTDGASVEVAAATDLSGTTWRYLAVGV